jgi:hypothetical protein
MFNVNTDAAVISVFGKASYDTQSALVTNSNYSALNKAGFIQNRSYAGILVDSILSHTPSAPTAQQKRSPPYTAVIYNRKFAGYPALN